MVDSTPWFTVEKIDTETYAISEYKHWEQVHSYLLVGKEKALLIDSGLGVANIHKIVKKLITLPIVLITTHVHWDHIGGHGLFGDKGVHQEEERWINGKFPLTQAQVIQNLLRKTCLFPTEFNVQEYTVYQGSVAFTYQDGDKIDLGSRNVEVIHTPGHSPGHCCFFDRERGYLFSGDLIYKGKLDAFYPTTDPDQFWKSVQKVNALPIEQIYPGHFDMNIDAKMIAEIDKAFSQLSASDGLCTGSGIHEFNGFSIHL